MKCLFFYLCGVIMAGVLFGLYATPDPDWKKQTIEHSCAQYNSKTAEFEWLDTLGVKP